MRLRLGAPDTSAVDLLSKELEALPAGIASELPHGLRETFDTICEKPELFIVAERDIRLTRGAYEMVDALKPTAEFLAFMAALRAWISERQSVDILD